jgi:hypothetical protein
MAYVTNCAVTNISGKAANYLQVVTKKKMWMDSQSYSNGWNIFR